MVQKMKLKYGGFTMRYNKAMGLTGCYGTRMIGAREELENLKSEVCDALDDSYKSMLGENCAGGGSKYWEHANF